MKENELMMSDIPWAVAWYGNRQCIWLTLNAEKAFSEIHDFRKPVKAAFTPLMPASSKRCAPTNPRSKVCNDGVCQQPRVAAQFPTCRVPRGYLPEQLFITDVDRWNYTQLHWGSHPVPVTTVRFLPRLRRPSAIHCGS